MSYQRLIEEIHSKGFSILDNFLCPKIGNELLDIAVQLEENNQLRAAKIGTQETTALNTTIRKDKIHWLDEQPAHPAIKIYFDAIIAIATTLNQAFYLGLNEFETHFAYYAPGSFYKKHIDQFNNKKNRQISFVYYLNAEWQESFGGHLSLYDKEDKPLAEVLPTFNRLICFQSDLPHEVNLTTQPRWSIAGWMKTRT